MEVTASETGRGASFRTPLLSPQLCGQSGNYGSSSGITKGLRLNEGLRGEVEKWA